MVHEICDPLRDRGSRKGIYRAFRAKPPGFQDEARNLDFPHFAKLPAAADDPVHEQWADRTRRAILDSGLVEPAANTINHSSALSTERIREVYGADTYERLRRLKAEYDPANLFASNANIPPANDDGEAT